MDQSIIIFLCRFLVGGIMVVASLEKLRSRRGFQSILTNNYAITRPLLAGAVSLAIPAVELAFGSLVLLGVLLPFVAWATAAFLLALSLAVAFRLKEGADCGCGIGAQNAGRRWLLGRNLALIAVALSLATLTGSTGFEFLVIALPVLVIASLALTQASEGRQPQRSTSTNSRGITRRSFLQILGVGAGLAFSAAFASSRSAEAACYGCKTCSAEYVLYQCGDGCCTYLVRDREYCTSGCSPCSSWRFETYC